MNTYFAQNLKMLRNNKGLTQESLADMIGVSYQAVSKWERGDNYPDITILPILAEIFSISIDALLGYDKSKRESKINEYLNLYDAYRLKDRAFAFDEFTKAIKTFPNDYRIIIRYMELLKEEKDHAYLDDYEETSKKIISLFNQIQNSCTDDDIRIWSKHIICDHLMYKYECCGFDEKYRNQAEEIINTLPALGDSKEYLSLMIQDMNKWYEVRENAIDELLYLLQNVIISYCYYDDKFSADYKINIINHINELFKITDSDESYSKNRIHYIYNLGHLGHLYFKINNSKKAIESLILCAELSKQFDISDKNKENYYRYFEKGEEFKSMTMCQRMTTLMTEHYVLPNEFKSSDEFAKIISIMQ